MRVDCKSIEDPLLDYSETRLIRPQRDMQMCLYYPGVCIKRAVKVHVACTRFIHTKAKAYNFKVIVN